jgi:outer membrane protein
VKAIVAESYHTVLIASENVDILQKSLTVLRKTRQDTKAMFEQGFVEEQDLDQLDLSLADLNNRIAHASNQKSIALDLLKYQLGMPMSSTLTLSDSVDGLLTEGAVDMLGLGFNFQQSIDYDVLNTRVSLMDLNVKNEKVKSLPTIGGFYNYQKNAQRDSFDFFDGDKKWYPIQLWGVKMSVPIFTSFRGVHRVAKAKVEAERARMNLDQATQGATLEYELAKNDYSLALATYQNQEQSLFLAERIFNKTQIKYTEGIASSFDLAQAQTQLLQSQGSFIGGMLSVLNAKSRLSKSLNQYQ